MVSELAAWLIFFLPLASFAVIAFVIRPFFNRHSRVAGLVTIAAVAASFVLSNWALASVVRSGGGIEWPDHR